MIKMNIRGKLPYLVLALLLTNASLPCTGFAGGSADNYKDLPHFISSDKTEMTEHAGVITDYEPSPFVWTSDESLLDLRCDGLEKLPGILNAGYDYIVMTTIENCGTAPASVEFLPGTIMLHYDSNGKPVAPYSAPRDKYTISYELYPYSTEESLINGSWLVWDAMSAAKYYDNTVGDIPPPIGVFSLPPGNYDGEPVHEFRHFLDFPAAADYYIYDGDAPVMEDGRYKTRHFEKFSVKVKITVDLSSASGLEWKNAELFSPRLRAANGMNKSEVQAVHGLNEAMYYGLEWFVNPSIGFNGTGPLNLEKPSDVPFIHFRTQPAVNVIVNEGSIYQVLHVSARTTISSPVSYQWYQNTSVDKHRPLLGIIGSIPIPGATDSILNIPVNLKADVRDYYFYCVVSSPGMPDDISNVSSVTVAPPLETMPYGDFTGNGYVDGTDILWIQGYVASDRDFAAMRRNYTTELPAFYVEAADFAKNGIIDGTDILWINRYIACERSIPWMLNSFFSELDFSHVQYGTVIR